MTSKPFYILLMYDYQICKTKNCWHSVDAHFQDGAASELQLYLPLEAASISAMYDCNQSECS